MLSKILRSVPFAGALAASVLLPLSAGASEQTGSCTLKAKAGRRVLIGYVWSSETLEFEEITETDCRNLAHAFVRDYLECEFAYASNGNTWDDHGSVVVPCPIRRVKWKFETAEGKVRGVVRRSD